MSTPHEPADLGTLERKRAPSAPPRRRWLPRLVPLVVILAFLAAVAWGLRDYVSDRIAVTVLRPAAAEKSTTAAAGRVALQAAGWVEPDPFPLLVVPLTTGVLEEVLVQESDVVAAGDVVARLVAEDARLEFDAADATVAATAATLAAARTDLEFATLSFDEPIDLTERVEVARAAAIGRRSEAGQYAEAAARADADVRIAEAEFEVERHLAEAGAAGPRQVELARARVEAAVADRAEARARSEHAAAELVIAEARERAALREQELRIADRAAVERARRAVELAEATLLHAKATRDVSGLRLERVEVRAPWNGVVLERLAEPGTVVGGGTPVCSVFDPTHVRVRVDVPFEEIGRTFVGQRAEIDCEARPEGPYAGTVLRRVQRADIQKVTLEVQVRIDDPDGRILPDMLVQVRFLGDDTPTEGAEPRGSIVLVPTRLVVAGGSVWVVDPTEARARLRPVTLGATRGERTEVLAGLNLTDKLIDAGRERLSDGDRIRVREEDGR